MTTTSNSYGVVGTDGVAPVYDSEGRFQVWKKSEIYTGGVGTNRYVPKVDDLVIDMDLGGIKYRVASLDLATLIATLSELQEIPSGTLSDEDLLLGVGPGTQSDTYRIYIDRSVIPYAVAIEERLNIGGSMASYCRVFRGSDLNATTGEVISGIYDPTGNLIDNKIPLEVTSYPSGSTSGTNVSEKIVPVFYTTKEIPDNEVLTAVIYSDTGIVVSKRQLLAENTAFIRAANSAIKYVTGISMECPFLSASDDKTINLPINVLLQGLNMVGVVHYSDGTKLRMPVDGTKFALLGADGYIATVVGVNTPVVLRYRLSANEYAYGANSNGSQYHFSETYNVVTMQQDGAYSVKLFGYPVWVDAVNGYTLRWYLYNIDRSTVYDVTGYIEYSTNSPAFNPIAYGINQRITVAVNLQSVNGSYKNYRHVQTMDIILRGPGTNRTTNWTIAFEIGQSPVFGENNHADLTFVNYNYYKLKVDTGAVDVNEWLDRLYYRVKPLIDQTKEQVPPIPTHFSIVFGNYSLEFPIEQWNQEQVIGSGLADNGTVFIRFFKRTAQNDIQLAISAMPIYQTT